MAEGLPSKRPGDSERGGIWSALAHPLVYETFQQVIGIPRWFRKFVNTTIRPMPGERLLDVGCGPAPLLRHLPQSTPYIGFDRNAAYLETAKAEYGSRGQFICDDVSNFSRYNIEPVDIVVAIGLLHHIDDGLVRSLLDSLKPAMKPGARLITADPCVYPGQSPIIRTVVMLDRGKHVRAPEQYRGLCGGVFANAAFTIEASHFPFPHSVCTVRAIRQ